MIAPTIPERNIMEMKCVVYYRSGRLKIFLAKCDSAREAFDWCKENCEERGLFEYFYKGNPVYIEFY